MVAHLLPLSLILLAPLISSLSLPTLPTSHQLLARQDVNSTSPLPTDSPCSLSSDCLSSFCYGGLCTDPESVRGQVADGGQCFSDETCENFATGGSTCLQGICTSDLQPYSNGHGCQADDQCASASCLNGVCAQPTTGCEPACSEGFTCNTESRTCESVNRCNGVQCLDGQTCDPVDGTCKLVGGCDPACSAGQTCINALCTTNSTLITTGSSCPSSSLSGDASCESNYCYDAGDQPACYDPTEVSSVILGGHCFPVESGEAGRGNCDGQATPTLICNNQRICTNSTTSSTDPTVVATGGECVPEGASETQGLRRSTTKCWASDIDTSSTCPTTTSSTPTCPPPSESKLVAVGGACSATADCQPGKKVTCDNLTDVVGSGKCVEHGKVQEFLVPSGMECGGQGARCWSGEDKCPSPVSSSSNSSSSTASTDNNCLPLSPLAPESAACSAQIDCALSSSRSMACVGLSADEVGVGKCERVKPYGNEEVCEASGDCRSRNCENKICTTKTIVGTNPFNTTCTTDDFCNTGFCTYVGSATSGDQTCQDPFVRVVQDPCSADDQCASASCSSSACTDPVVHDVVPTINSATVPSSSSEDRTSLSTPIIAGIAVGGVVGIAILIAALFFGIKALKGGSAAATTALHATQGANQAHNSTQNQDPDDKFPHPKIQDFAVLMMGLEGAGKSTFIGRAQEVLNFVKFKPGKVARTPVKKMPETKIAFASSIMTFRDQSGAAARRPKWLNNISDHHSVCFIVDATNKEGINAAFTALQTVLHSAWMTGVPLLLLINKLDAPTAEPFEQIKQHFLPLLSQRPPGSAWAVMPLSALRGDGVSDAAMWLFTWSQTSKKALQGAATGAILTQGLSYV